MDKRTLKDLERLWIAEVNGKDCQLHKATAKRLEALGLVSIEVRRERQGPFTFTTELHTLTHAGRYAYCSTCTDEPEA